MFPALVVTALASPTTHVLPDVLNLDVVVFRHHPGLLDTEEHMAARKRDEKLILAAVKARVGDDLSGFRYQGGLGRGYTLYVRVGDLMKWRKLVDGLLAAEALGYYQGWGLNRHGYGFVSYRDSAFTP